MPFPVGNPTIVLVIAFFSGIQMLSLGVIGEYVGRIYDEARDRPKYILESRYGFESDATAADRSGQEMTRAGRVTDEPNAGQSPQSIPRSPGTMRRSV